jgi:hypothetical protein
MSATEIELEPQVPPSRRHRHQPTSPCTEPAGEAVADEVAGDSSPTPPATEPGSPAASTESGAQPGIAPTKPRRRALRATAVGFPWEVSPLTQFPMVELLAEIDRRHARARVLLAERKRILAQMATLEAEMEIVGPKECAEAAAHSQEPRPRRQRARNSVSLADALALAVEVRATVSPAEAAQLVLSNGYQSAAKNFGMVVANALGKDTRFKRVGRGRYERVAEQGAPV